MANSRQKAMTRRSQFERECLVLWATSIQGGKYSSIKKVKVLRMEFSIVENLSGPQESIFNPSRGPQLHFGEKSKTWSNFIKFTDFPPFPLFGVPWAAVIIVCHVCSVYVLTRILDATRSWSPSIMYCAHEYQWPTVAQSGANGGWSRVYTKNSGTLIEIQYFFFVFY